MGATAKFQTRFGKWLIANGIEIAPMAERTGLSRQWLAKLAWTERQVAGVTLRTMKYVLWAARQMKGPKVQMGDIFDLEPDDRH